MAESNQRETDERLNRLEAQMDTVLGYLERMSARLGAAPPTGLPTMIDPATRPAVERPVEPERPWIRTDQPPPLSAKEEPLVFSGPISSGPPPLPPSPPPPRAPFVPRKKVDWEDVVGRQWALWVGAIAVFLSVAFFLAYAWNYLSPVGRLTVGAGAGLTLLFCAEFARSRTERGFSEGLCGAGLAVLYLDAWAACASYSLVDFNLALVMMVAVTVVGVTLAVRYDSKSLHALATLGGFATPALLPGEGTGGSVAPFLTYVTVLNAGVLAVAVAKQWRENVIFAGMATIALLVGWSQSTGVEAQAWTTFTFVTLNFLLYAAAATLPAILRKVATESTDWLLLVAATAFYFAAGYGLTHHHLGNLPSLFPLALAAAFGGYALYIRFHLPGDEPLQMTCLGIACSLFALAVPVQLRQGWLSVGWSVEAIVLLYLAGISGSETVRRAGHIVWGLALMSVFWVIALVPVESNRILFNEHGIPVLAFALSSLMAAQIRRISQDEARPLYAAAWVMAAAWLIGEQVQYGFTLRVFALPLSWAGGEPLVISAVLAVWAAAAYAVNARVKDGAARVAAVGVAGIAVAITLASSSGASTRWIPILNPRFLAFAVNIVSLAAIAWISGSAEEDLSESESVVSRAVAPTIHVLVVVGVSLELFAAFALRAGSGWVSIAHMTIATFACCYAALMLLPAARPDRQEVRWLSWAIAAGGVFFLLVGAMESWGTLARPLANARFVDFLLAALALAAIAALSTRSVSVQENILPHVAMAACAGLALWGITQETYGAFAFYQTAIGEYWERWAQSAISVVWTVAGSGLLVFGIAREKRLVRISALGLIGVTVCKVFLFDLGYLENQYKVLSFGGLGVALIGISWLYSRFAGGEIHRGTNGPAVQQPPVE